MLRLSLVALPVGLLLLALTVSVAAASGSGDDATTAEKLRAAREMQEHVEAHLQATRIFRALGSGPGTSAWTGSMISYYYDTASLGNFPRVREVTQVAMAHVSSKTCVRYQEVDPTTFTNHTFVIRAGSGTCTGGPSSLTYDGCGDDWSTVAHELLHVLGISHEHQRWDQAQQFNILYGNIKTDFYSAYTPTVLPVGQFDPKSVMFYFNGAFNNGNGGGITYQSNTGWNPTCPGISDGDVSMINFVTQGCMAEPVQPRCISSMGSTWRVGSSYVGNITFFALYRTERPAVTITGLPPGSSYKLVNVGRGTAVLVQITPSAAASGNTYALTANFGTTGGNVSCATSIVVDPAPLMCNGIPSTRSDVCSGHGACNSPFFPQCACATGYGGAWCEGTPRCPFDAILSFDDKFSRCMPYGTSNTTFGSRLAANGATVGSFMNITSGQINIASKYQVNEVTFDMMIGAPVSGNIFSWVFQFSLSSKGAFGGVSLVQRWVAIRLSFDWPNAMAYMFANGVYIGKSSMAGTSNDRSKQCASDPSNDGCNFGAISISVSGSATWFAIDNMLMYCGNAHVSSFTTSTLATFASNQAITFKLPASTAWLNESPLAVCKASPSSILDGATVSGSGATQTLSLQPSSVAVDATISCAFSGSPVVSYALAGACPRSATVTTLGTKTSTTYGSGFSPSRPPYMVFTFVLDSAGTWTSMRVSNATSSAVFGIDVNTYSSSNYVSLQIANRASFNLFNPGSKTRTSQVVMVAIDWVASNLTFYLDPDVANPATTTTKPSLVAPFVSDRINDASWIWWNGLPSTGSTASVVCPASTPAPSVRVVTKTIPIGGTTPQDAVVQPTTVGLTPPPGSTATPSPPSGGAVPSLTFPGKSAAAGFGHATGGFVLLGLAALIAIPIM